MQSIVMDTSPLQGWTTSNYKSFKAVDESSESGSDSDSDSESEAPRRADCSVVRREEKVDTMELRLDRCVSCS